jgi:hypothetical protein
VPAIRLFPTSLSDHCMFEQRPRGYMIPSPLAREAGGEREYTVSIRLAWPKYHFCPVFERVIGSIGVKLSFGSRR